MEETGGRGGVSNSDCVNYASFYDDAVKNISVNSGRDGLAGESCGIVTINNRLTVYAYGGGRFKYDSIFKFWN